MIPSRFGGPLKLLAFWLALLIVAERPAYGYTDPGTGALIWQMLLAGFVGALFYIRKFTSWFRAKKRESKD